MLFDNEPTPPRFTIMGEGRVVHRLAKYGTIGATPARQTKCGRIVSSRLDRFFRDHPGGRRDCMACSRSDRIPLS